MLHTIQTPNPDSGGDFIGMSIYTATRNPSGPGRCMPSTVRTILDVHPECLRGAGTLELYAGAMLLNAAHVPL